MTSMSATLAAGLTVFGLSAFAALVYAFDKFAPARFVRERHNLALSAFFLTPVLFLCAMSPADSGLPAIDFTIPVTGDASAGHEAAGSAIEADAALAPSAAVNARPLLLPASLVPVIWLTGAAFMLMRLIADIASLLALKARSDSLASPAHLRLSRSVELRRSADISAPLFAGYFQPMIIVPNDFAFDDKAQPVLEHEIAHMVRRDPWTALFQRIVTSLFWWALPLYVLHAIVSRNREALCDAYAATATNAPQRLAHALLDAAARAAPDGAPALALGASMQRSALAARIRHLTSDSAAIRRQTLLKLPVILAVLAATALLVTPRVGAARSVSGDTVSATSNASATDEALFRAVRQGRIDDVRRLIDDGANPNVALSGEGAPLIAAARNGDADIARLLLDAGANPNLGVRGDGNPLIAAARRGDMDIVELLVNAGADVNGAVLADGNPLIGASAQGHADVVRRLLSEGANPNGYVYRDETPLINAARQGHIRIAEILTSAGADVSMTVETPPNDPGGPYRSPLSEAERNGRDDMVRWLNARGAEHRP